MSDDLFRHRDEERLTAAGYRKDAGTAGSPWEYWWNPAQTLKLTEAEALAVLSADEAAHLRQAGRTAGELGLRTPAG